jgi:hypothetical protein
MNATSCKGPEQDRVAGISDRRDTHRSKQLLISLLGDIEITADLGTPHHVSRQEPALAPALENVEHHLAKAIRSAQTSVRGPCLAKVTG